jgi:hypothetical protein
VVDSDSEFSLSGALFQLLMDMVTEQFSPEDPIGVQLSSIASACLLSLVVALGDTGKMLSALAAMLTAPSSLSEAQVKVKPHFLYCEVSTCHLVTKDGKSESQ